LAYATFYGSASPHLLFLSGFAELFSYKGGYAENPLYLFSLFYLSLERDLEPFIFSFFLSFDLD
jgi:hypothetical protein